MQGVESLFKEAEASGRLGELAAVAAGQGGDGSGTTPRALAMSLEAPAAAIARRRCSPRQRQRRRQSSRQQLQRSQRPSTRRWRSCYSKISRKQNLQSRVSNASSPRLRGQPLYLEDGIVDEPVILQPSRRSPWCERRAGANAGRRGSSRAE
jgi:hypothetical protein